MVSSADSADRLTNARPDDLIGLHRFGDCWSGGFRHHFPTISALDRVVPNFFSAKWTILHATPSLAAFLT